MNTRNGTHLKPSVFPNHWVVLSEEQLKAQVRTLSLIYLALQVNTPTHRCIKKASAGSGNELHQYHSGLLLRHSFLFECKVTGSVSVTKLTW